MIGMFFFFFSSRRRHTRLQGDWSSDVCSSDLDEGALAAVLWQAWLFNYTRANHAAATAIGRELEERMIDAVDPAARIVAQVPLGLSLFAIGKPLEAQAVLEQAVRTYNELKGGP